MQAWKQYQTRRPTSTELQAWFANPRNGHDAVCLVCGEVSGHLEMIDFDGGGELFEAWTKRVEAAMPGLLDRLAIEATPSTGWHAGYRCQSPVCGNLKLAQRKVGEKIATLIETRGEGGLFLCDPTPGYELVQGSFADLPVLTEAERDVLLQAAWELNEYWPPVVDGANGRHGSADVGQMCESSADNSHLWERSAKNSHICGSSADDSHHSPGGPENARRPGDDFNDRGDPRHVLARHGWMHVSGTENEYWRRPGKESGWSATLKGRVFYVFSSNAAPFEPNRAYSPFAVYTLLNHGGDFEQAARTLRLEGYGGDSRPDHASGVNISAIVGMIGDVASHHREHRSHLADPGPLTDEMLRVPGFINEVMDHCLETAPYPNPVMAFAGALSLLAFLAGRKVRDSGDNRTNLYLLGLAHSAAGKDWPRKVNTRILHEVGLADRLGERFASGEGIQDALFQTPSMLFQTDEIDGMLQSINKAKDARHEAIMSTLLTMYSAANSVFPMRRKAGKESPGVIDQPHLVIFGTAIPNHYYEALSERMLTNGFFARMIILEAGQRGSGQEPTIRELPERVLEAAAWWANYQPGGRRVNLVDVHPVPAVVEHTDEARCVLVETREQAEAEYADAEANSDSVGTTVWGRVSEQTRKLALLHAISEDHRNPRIDLAAAQWASEFVMHQTRRMLFMASSHVAENPFHAECLKVIEKLREAPGRELSHQVLLKRMKMKAKDFRDLIETLVQGGEITADHVPTVGRTGTVYRLG